MCGDRFCLGTEKGSEVSLELMGKESDYKDPHILSTVFIAPIHCNFEAGNDLVCLNSNGMAKH